VGVPDKHTRVHSLPCPHLTSPHLQPFPLLPHSPGGQQLHLVLTEDHRLLARGVLQDGAGRTRRAGERLADAITAVNALVSAFRGALMAAGALAW
jgi:hypothetical protein